jgi:DNA-binding response OmpR family regulator
MKKILVVDDENSVRDLIQLILKREKYEVIIASDGKSALLAAKEQKPDLIIWTLCCLTSAVMMCVKRYTAVRRYLL